MKEVNTNKENGKKISHQSLVIPGLAYNN